MQNILPFYTQTGIVLFATGSGQLANISKLAALFPYIPSPLSRLKNSRNKRTDIEEIRHLRRYTAVSRHVPMWINLLKPSGFFTYHQV